MKVKFNLVPRSPTAKGEKTEWDLGTRLSEIGKFQNSKTLPISKGNMGRFSFHQNLGCRIFGNFHLRILNRAAFSKISIKEDNLWGYTQIFEKLSRKFFFHSTLLAEISRNFGWVVRISEIQPFPGFHGNLCGKFLYYLPLFPKFRKFWLNGRRLWCTRDAEYFWGIF